MAKVTYASLKLKINEDVEKIVYNGNEIEVLKYLPIEDKYSLISITLQKSLENELTYNSVLLDMYFHLHLVYLYTNITFTDKQREDESKLYDNLKSNGLMDEVIHSIPESEYNMLYQYLEEEAKKQMKIKRSFVGTVNSILNNLPIQMEHAAEIMNEFDVSKIQEVVNFAKAVNGGRDIQ